MRTDGRAAVLGRPSRPLAAGLDPDGVVRLRYGQHPVDVRPTTHVPGTVLLPVGLPVEQDIVWVFPSVAASPITPYSVRELVRQSWLFSVGVVFHRALIRAANPSDRPDRWVAAVRHAAQSAVNTLYTVRVTDLPAVDVVAGLETPIDLFGASDESLLRAVSWGFGAEQRLADTLGDVYRQTSTDIVRYRSPESLLTQEWSHLQRRLPALTRHYVAGSYDIVRLWNGDTSSWTGEGTLWSDPRRDRARALGEELFARFPVR